VGDSVRILSGDREGTVVTITGDDHDYSPYTLSGESSYGWYRENEVELVNPRSR
jgi:hypothetical protein